jgi:hypothetical protein
MFKFYNTLFDLLKTWWFAFWQTTIDKSTGPLMK